MPDCNTNEKPRSRIDEIRKRVADFAPRRSYEYVENIAVAEVDVPDENIEDLRYLLSEVDRLTKENKWLRDLKLPF
jgi:hypothetical protein